MRSPRRIILGVVLALGGLAGIIPRVPAQNPNNPKGIDVYGGSGTINWTSVKNSGVSFAFLKATEGIGFQDSSYNTNRTQAKAQGIVIGAYHFAGPRLRPARPPAASRRPITSSTMPSRRKANFSSFWISNKPAA